MSGDEKMPLYSLPAHSSTFSSEPVFEFPGGKAELRLRFHPGDGPAALTLRFAQPRAFRFRAEGHCLPWHVEKCYETLVEVMESVWADEVRSAEPEEAWGRWVLRHLMIYIDGKGCFELLAAGWTVESEANVMENFPN